MNKAEREELRKNPINVYCCTSKGCEKVEPFDTFAELKAHLINHHQQVEPLKGSKQMIMHMKGSGFYIHVYQFDLESGNQFTHTTKRAK